MARSLVTIRSGTSLIVSVPQRDLFRKYKWPARDVILARLAEFKLEGAAVDEA